MAHCKLCQTSSSPVNFLTCMVVRERLGQRSRPAFDWPRGTASENSATTTSQTRIDCPDSRGDCATCGGGISVTRTAVQIALCLHVNDDSMQHKKNLATSVDITEYWTGLLPPEEEMDL